MVITPHATTGAAIGSRAPDMATAFTLGLLSHYCLDAIPHRDYSLSKRYYLATDASLALLLILAYKRGPKAIVGALGGITPDLIEFGLPQKRLTLLRRIHHKTHSKKASHPITSLAVQAGVISLALALRTKN